AGRPNAYLNIQPRCPINANLAPLPVLVAALADVGYSGGSVSRSQAYNLASQVIIPYRANPSLQDEKQASLAPVTGTPQSRRWGIQHWAEFRNLIFSQGKAFLNNDDSLCAAVVANANPNTDLNKFVPDLCIDTRIDKNDVTRGTTELCFGTSGVFTIESLGVILGANGEPVATALVRSVQRVFDRHTDTTQGDFEAGRVDPPGFAIPGLRDICSLPESRNAENAVITGDLPNDEKAPKPGSGSPAGLFAAEYDGQLTFNVITMTAVAAPTQSTTPPVTTPGGVYVGFIDRTIRGTRNDASQNAFPPQNSVTNAPNKARTLENAGQNDCGDPNALLGHVIPPTAGAPDFLGGSDLHPLAVFLGRSGGTGAVPRELSFLQQDTANPYPGQGVVPGDQFLTSGSEVVIPVDQQIYPVGGSTQIGEVVFAVKEEILSWDFRPVDAMGFEFWFKPARRNAPIPQKIILLDWQAGGPQFPDAKTEDSLVQDEPPFPNYSATAVNGGTSGGVKFNPATFNSVVPGAVHATTHDKNINWGAGARLTIWLEPEGDTSTQTGQVDQSYTIHAKFTIQKNPVNQAPSFFKYGPNNNGGNGPYEKEWVCPSSDPGAPLPIRAGTWHHALFSWQTPPDMKSANDGQTKFSHFYVDGNEQQNFLSPAPSEPNWPSEISAQGQYIVAAVLNLEDFIGQIVADEIAASAGAATLGTFNASAVGNDTNPETYRLPVELSSGNTLVWVGQSGQTSSGEQAPNFGMDNAAPFLGLVDNIVFQDGYAKTIQAADFRGETKFIPRYDTYQPTDPGAAKTNSNIVKDLQDQPLFFQKHAHALDWSRPVRIIAADLTAWKQSASGQESSGAAVDLSADQGSVYLRLGWSDWRLEPTGVKANPFANDPDHATSGPDSQWITKFPLYTGPGAPLGFDSSKNAGWTMELSTGAPWNGIASGYLVPTREMGTPTPPVNFAAGGFLTRPGDHTLYALELRPFGDDLSGPRMAPVVDDVSIIYMRWDVNTVIEEEEVVDQN
ncbi:MAG TPA: hypothetical protein VFF73_02905, partial [Planctomycetota bacterium]|nr:hypothetical protein [Planctomycetota bacterium]